MWHVKINLASLKAVIKSKVIVKIGGGGGSGSHTQYAMHTLHAQGRFEQSETLRLGPQR